MPSGTFDAAELSSVRSSLEELTARVGALMERRRDRDDAVRAALAEAERSLAAAARALRRAAEWT
jgi:hypothetical protein